MIRVALVRIALNRNDSPPDEGIQLRSSGESYFDAGRLLRARGTFLKAGADQWGYASQRGGTRLHRVPKAHGRASLGSGDLPIQPTNTLSPVSVSRSLTSRRRQFSRSRCLRAAWRRYELVET